jgi:hypothetical protein
MPANHSHRVWTTDQETIFQFSYTGPFDMTFVNPADDPRKKGNNQTRQIHNCAVRAMFGRSEI